MGTVARWICLQVQNRRVSSSFSLQTTLVAIVRQTNCAGAAASIALRGAIYVSLSVWTVSTTGQEAAARLDSTRSLTRDLSRPW